MQQPSRRTLLAGAGSVLALGAAGCIGRSDRDDEPANSGTEAPGTDEQSPTDTASTPDSPGLPPGLETAFEYVYGPSDGVVGLRMVKVSAESSAGAVGTSTISAFGTPEWVVSDVQQPSGGQRGLVATGSFDGSPEGEAFAQDGSRGEFDVYRASDGDDERTAATDGDVLLLGEPSWVTATLDAHLGDEPTYRESTDGVDALLDVVDVAGTATLIDDDEAIEQPFSDLDVDTDRLPERLLAHVRRTDEEVTLTLAGWYESTPGESAGEPFETLASSQFETDQRSTEVLQERNLVVVRASRPYTPPEERPETAGYLRYHGYDGESDEVLLRFDDGEQLPVERYEIEIEDEVYEGEWARGQETIGEGSVVAIDADAIEPGDDLSVSYDSPDGGYGSSSGTTVLRSLPFAVEFDPDERTGTLRYLEGPPLEADRVSVLIHQGDEEAVREPWSGTLRGGDAVTLSDLDIEGHVVVRYDRSDGETVRIGAARFAPPGRFEFEYDGEAERLTIRYPDVDAGGDEEPRHPAAARRDQEPLSADRYEVTVDGEPAARQWTDVGDEVAPGASLTLEDVPVDTDVSVVWIGADGRRYELADTHTLPDVEFEFQYDAESGELTVTHAGGQSVDASKLAIDLRGDDDRTVEWDGDGGVSAGDECVVEDVPEQGFVVVTYGGSHLDHVSLLRLREEEEAATPESASA